MSLISQFRTQIRTYIYIPVYKGPFEYKKNETKMYRFPFEINNKNLFKEFDKIKELREAEVKKEEISPFHLVWRYKPLYGNIWTQKLVLRRLGLHHKACNIPVIIPNTPHYNKMLLEVKHLIRLKPLKFPDGFPTEKDIGSVKVDLSRGEMRINSAYKVSQESLDKSDSPPIFTGKYLREYLKWSSGLVGYSLPHIEVKEVDGNRIEEFDKKMKNYYKHQHKLYN